MTPLAHELAKQLVEPVRRRDEFWAANAGPLRDALADTHFFDVTAIMGVADEIATSVRSRGLEGGSAILGQYAFLPAPKTWIEWQPLSRHLPRVALLLESDPTEIEAAVSMFTRDTANNLGRISLVSDDYQYYGGQILLGKEWGARFQSAGPAKAAAGLISFAHLALLVINSPRVIGRRQHMPHRGLEKRLTRALGAGMFPLHGWTEIKLEINKPVEIDDGEPHEAHLTGRRALHFCRKHIRIRNGRLEYVKAHWRGDPALGIKQSRYRLTALSPTHETQRS